MTFVFDIKLKHKYGKISAKQNIYSTKIEYINIFNVVNAISQGFAIKEHIKKIWS